MSNTTRALLAQSADRLSAEPLSNAPIWVRPRQACELSGLGLTTLYRLINDGTLETRLVGRARLIRRIDLERLGAR
jgi:excisionase family DNA binding protein